MNGFQGFNVTSIERTCIACPASWFGHTEDGGSWYVRFRGGVFSLRYSDNRPENKDYLPREYEVYDDKKYDDFDGHMNTYELKKKLEDLGVEFASDVLPNTFYDGIAPSDCEFLLVGDWFKRATCTNCDYNLNPDTVETIQYETVVPENCPACGSNTEVETEKPERIKNWGN